jgi:hypothetical protein
MIMGQEKPDGGELIVGSTVRPMVRGCVREAASFFVCACADATPCLCCGWRVPCFFYSAAFPHQCVDQSRDALDDTKTVYEEMCGGADELVIGGRAISSRAYCTWYNFRGGDQQKRVGDLSGGERNRLQLAKTLLSGGNLLLLDGA